jgi:hypothetical protein
MAPWFNIFLSLKKKESTGSKTVEGSPAMEAAEVAEVATPNMVGMSIKRV